MIQNVRLSLLLQCKDILFTANRGELNDGNYWLKRTYHHGHQYYHNK